MARDVPTASARQFAGKRCVIATGRFIRSDDRRDRLDPAASRGREFSLLSDNLPAPGLPLIRQLSAPDLEALLLSGAAIELIDVRTQDERAIAAIDGSRLLDRACHDDLLRRDRDAPIVFQCHHGIRSQQAAEYFRQQGFRNLYNLEGGIDAWSMLVDPSVPRY
jgi:monothiol glutaredoxin